MVISNIIWLISFFFLTYQEKKKKLTFGIYFLLSGDSDQSSNTQKSMEDVHQTNVQMTSGLKFGSREFENDNFFDT